MSENQRHLISQLKTVLTDLQSKPYPTVPNPPETARRASVALIIRINPRDGFGPIRSKTRSQSSFNDFASRIKQFFEQKWVEHGDAEVLFIKRTSRKKDPWSGDIALPGGRRDTGDIDDLATAIRETEEEVGLDLREDNAIRAGNLAQRVVTASWGRKPLMVLCPFVFLLTEHYTPTLTLRPSEVASVHWVPLRALLPPSPPTSVPPLFQASVRKELTYRFAEQEIGLPKAFINAMAGSLKFSGIELIPSETKICNASRKWNNDPSSKPLILWGITFGIMIDFLELLAPDEVLRLWSLPTFTGLDYKLALWWLSSSYRKRERELFGPHSGFKMEKNDELFHKSSEYAMTEQELRRSGRKSIEADSDGERSNMDARTISGADSEGRKPPMSEKIDALLEGYHVPLCRAMYYTSIFRVLMLFACFNVIVYALLFAGK